MADARDRDHSCPVWETDHCPKIMATVRARQLSSYVVRVPRANVYRFGDSDSARPVLTGVDWTVREGESWAVVGSGAGEKTALLEVNTIISQPMSDFTSPVLIYIDPSWKPADISASPWRTPPISLVELLFRQ